MGTKQRIRLFATAAAMTTVMAAAVGCSSSGTVGAGANLDLKTVSAAQAVKDAQQAGAAKHSVHAHSTTTAKQYTQTVDGAQRTDQFQQDVVVVTEVTGGKDTVRGELRAVGGAVYLDDSGIPSDYRLGKQWIAARRVRADAGLSGLPPAAGQDGVHHQDQRRPLDRCGRPADRGPGDRQRTQR